MNRLMLATALLTASLSTVVRGQTPDDVSDCVSIDDADARLQCYDSVTIDRSVAAKQTALPNSIWRQRILDDAERDTFTLTARKPNYFLITSLKSVNNEPYELIDDGDELDHEEIKFQLSAQTKLGDDMISGNGDLWFSYTQISYWQLFNSEISAPFRETNYEPEIYLSFLTDYSVLGLTGSVINLGITHQSNGRGEPVSRSWNRAYVNFIFDRENLLLSFKPWVRFSESEEDDDNPDIEEFMGHYELQAVYNWDGQIFSTMLRNIFDEDHRYNAEFQWSFPISGNLRGLVQWYNGYGENLIDHDFRNNRIGFGVVMTDWL